MARSNSAIWRIVGETCLRSSRCEALIRPRRETSYSSTLRSTSASINCTMLEAARVAAISALPRSRISKKVTMLRMEMTINELPRISILSDRLEVVVLRGVALLTLMVLASALCTFSIRVFRVKRAELQRPIAPAGACINRRQKKGQQNDAGLLLTGV
ncbi:hypothetical protein EMIT0P201_50186 [Pseudomonas chlororaphis]